MYTSFQIVPLDYLSEGIQIEAQSRVQSFRLKVRTAWAQALKISKNQISWKVFRDHPKKDHSQGDCYRAAELKSLATFHTHPNQGCFHSSHMFHLHHIGFHP